jgi:electron transport complex protein RnfD
MVQSSPHLRNQESTQSIMLKVIIALVPAGIASVIIFGLRSLLVIGVCVASCVLFEYLYRRLLKKDNTISDLSAVVTGLLLAYNLPVDFPIWMTIIGCFCAIVIIKQLFGGIGQNFVNPAIAARVILLVAFVQPMTTWAIPQMVDGSIVTVAGATPLAFLNQGNLAEMPSYLDMFLGIRGGSLGETCIAALLLGGVFLCVTKVIKPTIPLIFMGTVALLSWILGSDPLYHLLAGGVVLGAIFMATDYTTSPATTLGQVIFAIGCGVLTVIIRLYGSYPEGVSFSILLMNLVVPLIDRKFKTKPFGSLQTTKTGGAAK